MKISAEPFDGTVSQLLIEGVQQEYLARYGGRDRTPVDAAEFAPPRGSFLVAWDAGGAPVGCGGWRAHRGVAELKRMYVVPAAHGRRIARALLAELERGAAAAGFHRIELETGTEQPEALALYRSAGYEPAVAFGTYRDEPSAVHLGKDLPTAGTWHADPMPAEGVPPWGS